MLSPLPRTVAWSCPSGSKFSFFKAYLKCHCLAFPGYSPLTRLLLSPFRSLHLNMHSDFSHISRWWLWVLQADTGTQHLRSNTHWVHISRSHHHLFRTQLRKVDCSEQLLLHWLEGLLSRLRGTCSSTTQRWALVLVPFLKCQLLSTTR